MLVEIIHGRRIDMDMCMYGLHQVDELHHRRAPKQDYLVCIMRRTSKANCTANCIAGP